MLDDQQLFQRSPGRGAVGVVLGIAQSVIHHHRIGHGREDRPQAVLTVQALVHEGLGLGDGALAGCLGKQALAGVQDRIEGEEKRRPQDLLVRAALQPVHLRRRTQEQLVDSHPARISRLGL